MNHDYLYHCAGCKKHDEEYPDKLKTCPECKGSGYNESYEPDADGELPDCGWCGGECSFVERVRPLEYHRWARNDAYGIYTGLYCDKCYKSNYPYKRGRYHDPGYCGERMEDN